MFVFIFFFKQKTAYEMRISDWSSDVCSSDLPSLPTPCLQADGRFIGSSGTHLCDACGGRFGRDLSKIRLVPHAPDFMDDTQSRDVSRNYRSIGGTLLCITSATLLSDKSATPNA